MSKPLLPKLSLRNLNHDPAADLSFDDVAAGFRQIRKTDFGGHVLEFSPIQVKFEASPGLVAVRLWAVDAIDTQKRHPS